MKFAQCAMTGGRYWCGTTQCCCTFRRIQPCVFRHERREFSQKRTPSSDSSSTFAFPPSIGSQTLSLVSWNLDLFRTPSSTVPEQRIHRIVEFFQEKLIMEKVDVIVVQESTPELAKMVHQSTPFRWVDEAQARTYHGFLQAFVNSSRNEWQAQIAWPYTCLTMDLTHRGLYTTPKRGNQSEQQHGNPSHGLVLRLSNVQLDSAEKNRKLREQSIDYLRTVPMSDIIIGDGSFRRDERVEGYGDAFALAGQPYSQRYTIDTYENQYWVSNPRPFAARYSRCYLRTAPVATDLDEPSRACITRVAQYEVLKRYFRTEPRLIGASDHYALFVRLEVGTPLSPSPSDNV